MRRGTIVNLNKVKVFDAIIKNRLIIIVALCFLIGAVSGSIAFGSETKLFDISEKIFKSYLSVRLGKSVFSILISSFLFAASVLVGMFLCGSSMLGVVLSPLAVFFGGFFCGSFCSYLYSQFSLKGIAFNAVIIIPSFIILIVCIIFSACDSVKFSLVLAKLTLPSTYPVNLYLDFKRYCGRYLIFVALCLISGLVDSVLSHSFLKLFDLS